MLLLGCKAIPFKYHLLLKNKIKKADTVRFTWVSKGDTDNVTSPVVIRYVFVMLTVVPVLLKVLYTLDVWPSGKDTTPEKNA